MSFCNLKGSDILSESVVASGMFKIAACIIQTLFCVVLLLLCAKSSLILEYSTRKILPKLVVQRGKEKPGTSILPDAVESIVPPQNAQIDSSETLYMDEGSLPTFPSEDALDYSSMSFSNFFPSDPTTSDLPMNEERINLAEASCSSDLNIFPQQDIPGVSAKEVMFEVNKILL